MVNVRRNDRVAVVAYDGLTTLEFAIPTEVFGLERPELARYYEMEIVAGEPEPLRGAFGVSITPDSPLDAIVDAGTVVIPGWRDRAERPPAPLVAALTEAHSNGARLVSICSGAFVLAATGLLDGGRATTHWMYADDLRRQYPAIDVDADVLFVDNGSVITAAGSAAGIDTCLHIVSEDWGAATAAIVARRLVVSPQRDGGQAQFVPAPAPDVADDHTIAALLDAVATRLDEQHSVASMAAKIHVSPRTLARRFQAATGTTPIQWLSAQRVRRARELLETTDHSVDLIARSVGFASPVTLRQQFQRRVRVSPSMYRARFGTGRPDR